MVLGVTTPYSAPTSKVIVPVFAAGFGASAAFAGAGELVGAAAGAVGGGLVGAAAGAVVGGLGGAGVAAGFGASLGLAGVGLGSAAQAASMAPAALRAEIRIICRREMADNRNGVIDVLLIHASSLITLHRSQPP
jgi:hypothetical protein